MSASAPATISPSTESGRSGVIPAPSSDAGDAWIPSSRVPSASSVRCSVGNAASHASSAAPNWFLVHENDASIARNKSRSVGSRSTSARVRRRPSARDDVPIGVAANEPNVRQTAQLRQRRDRIGPECDKVAEHPPRLDSDPSSVGDDRVQRNLVAVDVGDQSEAHAPQLATVFDRGVSRWKRGDQSHR